MAAKSSYIFYLIYLLVGFLVSSFLALGVEGEKCDLLSRKCFPEDFIFGAGSAAYQYEGAAYEDGKGLSIWDTFTKQHPEKIADGSNGDVAEDFYHRYKGDIKLMKQMGLDSFRFSISWPRILPKGKISGGINKLGIKFYNDLINELLANGIKPFVTLFHWDLPQALYDEYGGLLSPKIVNDFRDYADLAFKEFGDRVKYWATVNEPNLMTEHAYANGDMAPGRCSNYIGNCTEGNSATEPYIVGHHLLLCHAVTIKLYRQKYQASQNGTIGLSVATTMIIPINQTTSSRLAASRAIDFSFGWMLDPVVFGDYPKSMRLILGKRLPKFTKEESELLKQSFDFLGLNYYTTNYAAPSTSSNPVNLSYTTDSQATLTVSKEGVPIGEATVVSWLYIYPKGLQTLLQYIKAKYNDPVIHITENGVADANNGSLSEDPTALKDTLRIKYHSGHLSYLLKAINEGANVKGYFAWTFLDDFEWGSGFTLRFGINFVDFDNGLKRYPKQSFYWFQKFLAKA